jgi:hypothetical protein
MGDMGGTHELPGRYHRAVFWGQAPLLELLKGGVPDPLSFKRCTKPDSVEVGCCEVPIALVPFNP